jgi:hypothetical protein
MKIVSAWLVSVLMISVGIIYSYQIHKKDVKPALSTWLILLTGIVLSFATYIVAENKDYISGILNTIAVVEASMVVLAIIAWGDSSVRFKSFEKKYLVGAIGIVFFWILAKDSFTSNLLTQLLLFVGYLPTIQKLVREKNNESLLVWGLFLVSGIVSLYPAIVGGNFLSVVFSVRMIIMVSIIFSLIIYYRKEGVK